MAWSWFDNWIVVVGMLCAMSCALLGNFLVLRKMSMMGDAISHAALPGLAAAFLITGSRASLPMFIGAVVVGVLTALFTEWIRSFGKVDESASMGVVFTALFAVGLIMIVQAADAVDLDPGCVLYGAIELTPFDDVTLFGREVPRASLMLGGVFVLNLLFVLLFFKELKISSFDPALATTLGFNAKLMHYLLMTMVAITTVASFESVGSILVVAMLIVPGATAHLLTERLGLMIVVSMVIAAASAALGHVAAISVPGWFGLDSPPTAGPIAVVIGGFFLLTMLLAPRHGVISRTVHRWHLSMRIRSEDMLGLLYRLEEHRPAASASGHNLRRALGLGRIVNWFAAQRLLNAGQATRVNGAMRLTDAGRADGRDLVRSHRLWESYLVKFLNLPSDHVETSAQKLEHVTDATMQRQLDERVERPSVDPQGKVIPPPRVDDA